MSVTAQQLVEELQIFGLECEEAVTEKRESLAPFPALGRVSPGAQDADGSAAGVTCPKAAFSVRVRRGSQLSCEVWDVGGTFECSEYGLDPS